MGSAESLAAIEAILKLVQILAIVGGLGLLLFKVGRISAGLESALKRQSEILDEQRREIREIKDETKKINDVLKELAVQNTRLNMMDERYEEIRRVVFPLPPPVMRKD